MTTFTHTRINPLAREVSGAIPHEGTWTLSQSYLFCQKIATSHYENFPVGSLLVPARLRKHFYSIYAFARIADDFADEHYQDNHAESDRLDLLDWWMEMLLDEPGRTSHPVFIALAETREQFDLPLQLFVDLLSAFKQDVTVRRYDSFDQLVDYCRRSANPIGRLILQLFGYKEDQLYCWSDSICTALQLANHWQDVAIDLDKDRVYLPLQDLGTFGVDIDDLKSGRVDERLRGLMKFQVDRTEKLFRDGKPLCTEVRGRLGLELRVVWLGGMTILNRLRAVEYDVFTSRPAIGAKDKLTILAAALNRSGFRRR
ncbi:MAG TPA: squalene synthase HpnC [Blastocatellia bacterium]|nr:squalene synthase HpnC [Blastocatellia bacterium]